MSAIDPDVAPAPTIAWGGLADTIRNDCTDTLQLDGKTSDLLRRLDELAACSSITDIRAFLESARCFSDSERDYLMSPLLDDIFLCSLRSLASKTECIEKSNKRFDSVQQLDDADHKSAASAVAVHRDIVRGTRIVCTELAVTVACMTGLRDALLFFAERGADF